MTKRIVKHTTVYLYDSDIILAQKLGYGNISKGVRIALRATANIQEKLLEYSNIMPPKRGNTDARND